ncbi:MAG: endonuclease [Candidatus Aenigmarchaeota archaeon]|nr:endonuclease [Candidatus Aenigmarchaeota archaeon]
MVADELFFAVIAIAVAAVILYLVERSHAASLRTTLSDSRFQNRSLSVKYGKMSEQFFPFLNSYPYDRQNFRFIGSPIDGVQFNNDRIVFVEFKTSESSLSEVQKKIRELVKGGKVEFREIRIK